MAQGLLAYERMVQTALRGVVRQALTEVAQHGLPGQHHFYITFRTDYPGVVVPPYLSQQYRDGMTVVLQHKFSGLDVEADAFSVTLWFKQVQERLTIPFNAIVVFADPSQKFELHFEAYSVDESRQATATALLPLAERDDGDATTADDGTSQTAEVVSLDTFRKK